LRTTSLGLPLHKRGYAKGVLTDLVQIRQLTEMHRADTLTFQRHLAAHHYPDGPFRILARTVEQQIDCTACANCCRQTRVSLSEAEIAVIARYLELESSEVVRQYTIPDADNSSARILRHSKDGCVFLDGNLCMVYEARPRACQEFPHLSVSTRSLGSRMSSVFRRAGFCPIVYNVLESYKKLIGYHPHPH
jgi:uncharacterized protein